MIKKLKSFWIRIVLVVILVVVAMACYFSARYVWCLGRPPICRSTEELYYVEPEILHAVQPHLANWTVRPPNETKSEREKIGKELGVNIDVFEWSSKTSTGRPVTVVAVSIETYYDWTRGFFYVNDDTELLEDLGYRLRHVDEHIFAYNTNY